MKNYTLKDIDEQMLKEIRKRRQICKWRNKMKTLIISTIAMMLTLILIFALEYKTNGLLGSILYFTILNLIREQYTELK